MSTPAWDGPRLTVVRAATEGGGPVAGRLEGEPASGRLRDASGAVDISWDAAAAHAGDLVRGTLVVAAPRFLLDGVEVLAPCSNRRALVAAPLAEMALRAAVFDGVRGFFRRRGFLEVATPSLVRCPGMEPHLRAYGIAGERESWLRTSPELALKRLLAGGAERIFEIARVYRAEESGPWHLGEFDMLEWYRAYDGLEAIAADCEALVGRVAARAGRDPRTAIPGVNLRPPFTRITVREAVKQRTGLDLAELRELPALAEAVRKRGQRPAPDDDWDTVFFRLWTAEVEPGLGHGRPVLVFDYPASQAALARVRPDPVWPVAERFELYIKGIELANAFHELNDPAEQRRRHMSDRATRRRLGTEVYPLDEAFLGALEAGMPPAAGIAFGLDRLVALLAGRSSVMPLGGLAHAGG